MNPKRKTPTFRLFVFTVVISFSILLLCIARTSALKESSSSSTIPKLSTAKLRNIALSTVQLIMEDVDNILFERIPDTDSHRAAEVYIRNQFKGTEWIVETDTYTATTPHGPKQYTNIIVTHNSNLNEPFILLGAHYDSKYFKDKVFYGAIDSALPCALLIDIGRDISTRLSETHKGPGLKIVFFDGEEAWGDWSETDSLYGSRHLAEKWETTLTESGKSLISQIEVMVLLDLLGAEAPAFYSMHQKTEGLFDHIAGIESRLAEKKLITKKKQPYFKSQRINSHVDDDHRPFMTRGVPVLHIIPLPFPSVWHTQADDRSALHINTIDDLSKILKVFVAEYLRVK